MSRQYSDDEEEKEQASFDRLLRRFPSTKGAAVDKPAKAPKVDGRSKTSPANMEKARLAKLAGLQKKKAKKAQEVEVSDSDTESEEEEEEEEKPKKGKKVQRIEESESEEEYTLKPKAKAQKGRGRAPPTDVLIERLSAMENAFLQLQKQAKKKPVSRKTVINVAAPTPAAPNPKAAAFKHDLLGL